jgi:hypothetical protein
MSPRKYEMSRRGAAMEQTRARIVAATVAAHRELGIGATSWDEIARRAGVGVGTVYRRRERGQLPQLEDYHQQIEDTLDALVGEALRPLAPSPVASDIVRALIDLPTWRAFTDRGFTTEQAIEVVSGLIECSLRAHSPAVRVG